MGKIEIFRGKNEQWYFRFRADNGKIVAQSEGYKQKQSAHKGIECIQKGVINDNFRIVETG